MTPAEHRAEAECLLARAADLPDPAVTVAAAQVHATLALAPAPPPSAPPSQRIDTSKTYYVADVEANVIYVGKAGGPNGGGVVIGQDRPDLDWGTVIEDPAQLRLFASVLTAHADRLESRP